MVIAKHDDDFLGSEVMVELQRKAAEKGHFDLTPEETVLAAAARVEPSLAPSDNLQEDIIRLANGLRKKGFEKEASEIEKNFILLKTAESGLYNVHGETGEDLLEFAHPDCDVEIAPSEKGLGQVESLLSAHKKFLEMINKKIRPVIGKI